VSPHDAAGLLLVGIEISRVRQLLLLWSAAVDWMPIVCCLASRSGSTESGSAPSESPRRRPLR
jgi:hypothetical protein